MVCVMLEFMVLYTHNLNLMSVRHSKKKLRWGMFTSLLYHLFHLITLSEKQRTEEANCWCFQSEIHSLVFLPITVFFNVLQVSNSEWLFIYKCNIFNGKYHLALSSCYIFMHVISILWHSPRGTRGAAILC